MPESQSVSSTSPHISRGSRHGIRVMFAGIFAAGVGLIVLIVASIRLSIEDNSQFVVFWSALYLVFAVVSGLSVEITRNVSMAGSVSNESGKPARHHISGITWIATGLVVALGFALMPVWRLALPTLTGLTNWIVCGALVFGVAGYIAQAGLIGALAGKQQWSLYSLVVALEAGARLIFVSVAAVFFPTLISIVCACVMAEYAWLAVLIGSTVARQCMHEVIAGSLIGFLRRVAAAMTGQGLSAVLLVGFPWLVGLTTEKEAMLFSAPLMLAVSLTRAPIMVPLSSMYTFAISYFTRRRSGLLTVMRMLGAVLGVGVIIAGLAWLVGPPLLDLIEPEYVIAGAVLAWLTIGAACIAMISLTGILCQARAAYATYIGGWVVAVIVAIIILVLPQPLQWRVIVALIVGPISGIIVHLAALSHRRGNVVPPQ